MATAIRPRTESSPAPAPARRAAIRARGLSRSFGEAHVVSGLDFEVRHGEIFGLIGPSGSGKSTLVRMLIGELVPSAGEVLVGGRAPARFGPREREQIGYMPQGFVLYPNLTVEQNARFIAGIYGIGWVRRRRRIRELLRLFELWEARRKRAGDISGGMQRRLSLVCALLHNPSVLFIDEPTAGLDPLLRTSIWAHLARLRDAGDTIVVTTQNLDDAAQCDRVALMESGQIVALGTPEDLKRRALGGVALEIEAPALQGYQVEDLRGLPGVQSVRPYGFGGVRVIVEDADVATPFLTEWLRKRGVAVETLHVHEPSFDEAFVALLREDGRRAR
jgi:ABC-2 type transport system ATP-binding protein